MGPSRPHRVKRNPKGPFKTIEFPTGPSNNFLHFIMKVSVLKHELPQGMLPKIEKSGTLREKTQMT